MDAAVASVITSGVLGTGGLAFAAWSAHQERAARKAERVRQEHLERVRQGAEALAPIAALPKRLRLSQMAIGGVHRAPCGIEARPPRLPFACTIASCV